jgi:hypothetical protein
MSGVRWNVVSPSISTGTSLKTLVQVIAASNHRILVEELNISFDGISNTAQPIKVEVLRQTTAGTVTALTPVKGHDGDDETLQITAGHTATAEPTAGDILEIFFVHPQGGRDWQAPFSKPFVVKGGGRLGVRVTAAASVNAVVTFKGEE